MKTLNILILFFTITVFTSTTSSVIAEDCATVKKLHKKIACKARGDATGAGEPESAEPKKTWGNFFKNIKELGGKNVGEAG